MKLVSILNSPMQLSNNFISSVEVNDLVGTTTGTTLLSLTNNADVSNPLISQNGAKYQIESNGFGCLNNTGFSYRTTNTYPQQTGITIVAAVDIQNISNNTALFGRVNTDRLYYSAGGNLTFDVSSTDRISAGNVLSLGKFIITYRRGVSNYQVTINNKVVSSGSYSGALETSNESFYFSANSTFIGSLYQFHIIREYLNDDSLLKLTRHCAFKSGIKI